jgi:hypothetical protein
MSDRPKDDLVALLSMAALVLGGGVGLMLPFMYTIAPRLVGSLDAPLNGMQALGAIVSMLLLLTAGGVAGGVLWVLIAGRILPRATVVKWLLYGPQIPPLTRLSLRLLDLVSKDNNGVPPAA